MPLYGDPVESSSGSGRFREELDLSGITDKFEVFGGTAPKPQTWLPKDHPYYPFTEPARPGEGENPAPVGSGPLRCSTSRQIATRGLGWAWDPNRYYRDLGVAWPYVTATRGDLRRAYQAADGQDSERLTYCLKQLVTRRAEYDALPLGEMFLDDIYVQQALKRKATQEASRRSARGQYSTADEVLDDWGFVRLADDTPDEDSPRILDETKTSWEDEPAPDHQIEASWNYSFYLWKTTKWDTPRLREWQEALIREVDPHEVPALTVGLMGDTRREYAVMQTGGEWVVFLHREAEVTPGLAASAAAALSKLTAPTGDLTKTRLSTDID